MASGGTFAVFDVETNGFRGKSVVSASSIVFTENGRVVDFFNRFYYPEERPDFRTEAVHGLTVSRIGQFRTEEEYPRHFLEDWQSLAAFWDSWNPEGIVVHNLSFDISFLPREAARERKWWCSMRGLTDFCRIPKAGSPAGMWKWPRLGEASLAARKKLSTPAPLAKAERIIGSPLAHYGLSDCFELYGLFVRVWNSQPESIRFRSAAALFLPPEKRDYPPGTPVRDFFVSERLAYSARLAAIAGLSDREEQLHRIGDFDG